MDSHAYLNNGRINAGLLRERAQQQLINLFEKMTGSKTIVWDRSLVGPVGLLLDYPFLKRCGVSQMYMLGACSSLITDHVLFFVRPLLQQMKELQRSIIKEDTDKRKYHVLFAPRSDLICEKALKDCGLFDLFESIRSFPAFVFPLDSDVLSLEMDHVFRSLHVNQDTSPLYDVASALVHIQQLYGSIPTVYGLGNTSRQVYTLMQKLTRTQNKQSDNFGKAQIDALLLIDRSIDLYSPLLTQLTYEGLLDELFGIRNNSVKVAASKFAQIDQQSSRSTISSTSQSNVDDPPTELKQIMLHSAEMLYSQLRDLNFNAVPLVLKQTSRTLNSQFEQRHEARSVGELRAFVERIPQLQATKKSLATHLVLAEQLSEVVSSETFRQILTAEQQLIMSQQTEHAQVYIEQAIACSEPFNRVLRLLCLQSLVCNGIKTKMFESLKRELLQVYGYEQLLTMSNLAKCGLFKAAGAVSTATKNPNRNYTSVGRLLRLTADNVNEQNPNDAAYVHSCFAPICARVVQLLLNGGWRAVADVMRQLNESHFEHHQTKGNEPYPLQKTSASIHSGSSAGNEEPRTLMVFFIGGCTFAEISSLRFLVRHEEANADIIVGTTKLINGNNFIDSLCEKLEANP